ncbi:hypothetical protein ABIA23_004331 [Sinorhizobium fredii]
MKRDLYETLGVARNADEKELKSAFRKLAMKYHPDRNPGDQEAEKSFKEINQAYETLKDPQKRAAYDRYGHAAFEQGGMGAGNGFAGGSAGGFSDIFEDIFGEMMGGGRQRRSSGGRERGADLRYNMEITLEEAYSGKTAQIRVPTSVTCDVCTGSGAKPGTSPKTCAHLSGLRPHPRRPGLLLDRTHLPDLRRPRPDDHRSLHQMSWPGPGHRGAHAVGQHSDRHRGRHAHPPLRRGRSRPARRSPRRPLYFSVGQAA